jgi:hypothetical protein
MIKLFTLVDPRRYIDAGRVNCPLRCTDVEADVCAGCRWLQEIHEEGKLPYVRCSPPAPVLLPEA